MSKKLLTILATAAVIVLSLSGNWVSKARGASSSYAPVLDPANFVTVIDNPYFPLPVGRTLVYQGTKDGQTQIDTVTVTNFENLDIVQARNNISVIRRFPKINARFEK